ncbi:MAG: ribose-5-phosphate isomerase RpiA [Acidimicrobiia bacterium]
MARPRRHPLVTDRDELKQAAGERAVDWVESGMVVGLGSGSTAVFAIRRIGALVQSGELQNVIGVPTSRSSEELAREVGITLTTLAEHPVVDVTIDGADEVDPELNLIKGGGGALLHEKIVAQASLREVIIVDDVKLSPHLGSQHAVPVEIVQFAWRPEEEYLTDLGAEVDVRRGADNNVFVTDEGNWVLDCTFPPIEDPARLSAQLGRRAGVVEHGLFLGLATDLIVASAEGVEHRAAP